MFVVGGAGWIHFNRQYGFNSIIQHNIFDLLGRIETYYTNQGDYWLNQVVDPDNWCESWYVGFFLLCVLSFFVFSNIFQDHKELSTSLKKQKDLEDSRMKNVSHSIRQMSVDDYKKRKSLYTQVKVK